MQPFCFEFGDHFIPFGQWELAFRVYSESNVYALAAESLNIEKDGTTTVITTDSFAWAGLQKRMPGTFKAVVEEIESSAGAPRPPQERGPCAPRPSFLRWSIEASLPERIKGTTTYVRGIPEGQVADKFFNFVDHGEGKFDIFRYPTYSKVPVHFYRHGEDDYTYAVTEDTEIRGKTFSMQYRNGHVLELHHHEDARKWSTHQQTPAWRLGKTHNPLEVLEFRMNLMEKEWGLKPWEERPDVPGWARQICLTLNLHGTHWTGFIMNDYARQLEIIRYVSERIDGQHVLAYLPAWDGRYNYNWPRYEPDHDMGGAGGLRQLVDGAHQLGVHVIPQIGAQSANRAFLPAGLHDSAFQDAYGNTYSKAVEWDRDHMPDTYRVNASMGHPGFRQFLFDKACGLKERFNFDGIFFDINQAFHNDPRFHVTDGHQEIARRLQERFDDFLVFGETWYDGLLPAYPLVHIGALEQWNEIFEKYCRQTYHLYHPAPGHGSTGVYDCGYREPFLPDPEKDIIPAIAFVEDTFEIYRDVVDQTIEIGKAYGRRKGIIE